MTGGRGGLIYTLITCNIMYHYPTTPTNSHSPHIMSPQLRHHHFITTTTLSLLLYPHYSTTTIPHLTHTYSHLLTSHLQLSRNRSLTPTHNIIYIAPPLTHTLSPPLCHYFVTTLSLLYANHYL